ncbi:hypothetical protein M436DRAFT_72140 [Aureobasidium namibiae CBS 147.97]|uniref:Uncharacterized protein n=1 Tax=Aureobasidium namibiae CBS 147.97 TaxID=1043004 RepID=A0A074WKX3_9PEZI
MPRGSEYSDEKRAAALIMFLIFKASHSDVEAKTGVSKTAIRQLSSRAHKAGVDRTSIEELIVFARTKPRKGRPRKDAAAKTDKAATEKTQAQAQTQTRQEEETTSQQALEGHAMVANQEPLEPPAHVIAAANARAADGENLFEIINTWNHRKNEAINASYAAIAREQA